MNYAPIMGLISIALNIIFITINHIIMYSYNDNFIGVKVKYIIFLLSVILHLIAFMALLKKTKSLDLLKKYVTKKRWLYYGIYLSYPILGSVITFMYIILISFHTLNRILLFFILINMVIGIAILGKFKPYFKYRTVKIRFNNGKLLYSAYKDFTFSETYIILKSMNNGKEIKKTMYNSDLIAEIDYIVDETIREQYEMYLKECFSHSKKTDKK